MYRAWPDRAPLNVGNKWVEVTYLMITDRGGLRSKTSLPSPCYIYRAAEGYLLKDHDLSIRTMSGLDEGLFAPLPSKPLSPVQRIASIDAGLCYVGRQSDGGGTCMPHILVIDDDMDLCLVNTVSKSE